MGGIKAKKARKTGPFKNGAWMAEPSLISLRAGSLEWISLKCSPTERISYRLQIWGTEYLLAGVSDFQHGEEVLFRQDGDAIQVEWRL